MINKKSWAIWVTVSAVILGLLITVGVLAGRLHDQQPTPAPTTTAQVMSLQERVDRAVAADGVPLVLPSLYRDAYELVLDDCNTMASLPANITPAIWMSRHLGSASAPGEAQALVVGIPLMCPEFRGTVGA